MKIKPTYIVMLVLVVLLVLQHQCTPTPSPQIIEKWDTIHTPPIIRIDSYPDPYPVYIEKIKWDTIKELDTIKVLGDYFSIKTFTKLYEYGDSLKIQVTDTISQNTLKNQYIKYELNIPQVRQTVTKIINQHEIYGGVQISMSPNSINAGAEVLYRSKTGQLYSLYYSPFNQQVGVGIAWRVFKF